MVDCAPIKLLVVDLDGTLLDSRDRVSDKNRSAIQRAAATGVIPVVASGRMRGEAEFVLRAIPQIRYFIGMNGCLVEDLHRGEILQNTPLPPTIADSLIRRLDEAGLFFQIYAGDRVYCTPASLQNLGSSGMSAHYLEMFGDRIMRWESTQSAPPVYKLIVVARDAERKKTLGELTGAFHGVQLLSSMPALGYHEVLPAGIDKAQALALLCGKLGMNAANVLAVGDSENDLGMLRYAGKSAAMRGGDPALHAVCDYIAPGNDADGVAAAIEHFLLAE